MGYTGTYTLEADCSGTLATVDDVSGDVLNFDLFLDPETGDFFFTATDAGEVSQGLNRKTR